MQSKQDHRCWPAITTYREGRMEQRVLGTAASTVPAAVLVLITPLAAVSLVQECAQDERD